MYELLIIIAAIVSFSVLVIIGCKLVDYFSLNKHAKITLTFEQFLTAYHLNKSRYTLDCTSIKMRTNIPHKHEKIGFKTYHDYKKYIRFLENKEQDEVLERFSNALEADREKYMKSNQDKNN